MGPFYAMVSTILLRYWMIYWDMKLTRTWWNISKIELFKTWIYGLILKGYARPKIPRYGLTFLLWYWMRIWDMKLTQTRCNIRKLKIFQSGNIWINSRKIYKGKISKIWFVICNLVLNEKLGYETNPNLIEH